MKRTLIVIALIAALIAPIWAQNDGMTPDGFDWHKDGNVIWILGYTGTATAVRIPDRINNLPVVRISDGAFEPGDGNTMITSVVVPNTVTTIGRMAFQNQSRLTTVTLSSSVTTIVEKAFMGCTALTSITLPSVTTIGVDAFNGCTALTTVSLPASITTIGERAFRYCTALTTIGLPASARVTIGANAFAQTNLDNASRVILQQRGYTAF